ncbi:MAG TPA: tripartite tricarboxylate transporter substrate-binding protein [Acetobacteraceae bacterium]|nr:tripartite tricarboxylate transporter substrate-binding protein [Acetobacteraceae bacterium]
MAVLLQYRADRVEPWRAALQEALPGEEIRIWPDHGDPAEIEAVVTFAPEPGSLTGFPNLRFIASTGAGVDAMLHPARRLPPGVPVLRLVEPNLTRDMALYVLTIVLGYFRQLDLYAAQQRECVWHQHPRPVQEEFPVGILGLGALGGAAAQLLAQAGFPVHGWSRTLHSIPRVATHAGEVGLRAMLPDVAVLVVLLPLTPATRGLVNGAFLARLRPGVRLINAARGALVVEQDLLAALDRGHLAHATLDVFEAEPLPPAHPFWRHPRVAVTPHIAALTDPRGAARQIAQQLRRARAGEELLHRPIRFGDTDAPSRERFMNALRSLLVALAVALPGLAGAQTFPERPVRIIVPFAAGGATDVTARVLAEAMAAQLPQPVVVENRAGGGGIVGSEVVARAAPDGHTLLVNNNSLATLRFFTPNAPIDPTRALAVVTLILDAPMAMLVANNVPAQDGREFVALLRANPGRYDYGTTGGGGTLQMAAILFLRATGVQMNEIPYRGGAPATLDLIAGRIALQFDTGVTGFQTHRAGQARAFAVTTPHRSRFAPEVPTWREIGVDDEFTVWQGVFMASGASPAVRQAVHAAVARAIQAEATQRRFGELGADRVLGGSIEESERVVSAEFARWERLMGSR